MKNQLLFILFAFITNALSAQGLSGNRFTFFYNANYHGSTFGAISAISSEANNDVFGYYNFKDDEKQSILKSTINLRHSLSLNYVLNRRTAIGVQFSRSRDAYGAGIFTVDNFAFPLTGNFKLFSVELDVKRFKVRKKGAIAPLGGYFAIRPGISSVKTNVKLSSLLIPDAEEIETEDLDFNAFSLALVWGKQFILYKSIMMNVGMEFKHTFISADTEAVGGINNDSVFNLDNESPKTRAYWNDFFRLTIGVGLAPF